MATVLAAASMPSVTHVGVFMVVSWTALLVSRLLFFGPISEADAMFVVWLAASQNVVIGPFAATLTPDHVRLLIGINFMLGAMWATALGFQRIRAVMRRRTVWILVLLPAVTLVVVSSVAVFGYNGLAAVASTRNIVTPILFFVVGWLIGCHASNEGGTRRFMRAIVVLGVIVIALGLVERYMTPEVWRSLNVGVLWEKKGLTNVGDSGVPRNWWSAERIGGEPIRRLVSTFADPVNLGTFLLLVMVCAYGLKRPVSMAFAGVGILLTVSKGGALGCLVFAVVFAYYRFSKAGFVLVGVTAAAAGASFIAYSARYATGSLFAHLGGAAYAVIGLPEYPLGRGVGRAGTLAQQFADLGDQQILESGLGIVAGQLGFPGLILFCGFFGLVYSRILHTADLRQRIVAVSLYWSITLNIIFNEVALSPNSAAGYFILLGLIAAKVEVSRRRADTWARGDDVTSPASGG